MSVADRLDDAEIVLAANRRDGAMLVALAALEAQAHLEFPTMNGHGRTFAALLARDINWHLPLMYEGRSIDLFDFLYRHVRSTLVHNAALPGNVQIDDYSLGTDSEMLVWANHETGGVHLSPGCVRWVIDQVRGWDASR